MGALPESVRVDEELVARVRHNARKGLLNKPIGRRAATYEVHFVSSGGSRGAASLLPATVYCCTFARTAAQALAGVLGIVL
jgi:hypothetical protein